jgi:homoserine dehydrogenase
MTQKSNIVVLKFGGSVLRNEDDLPKAVHEIYRYWRQGASVVAVVSAFGDTTDQLLRRAEKVCGQPNKSVLPSLLATGEATSSALLTLALNKVGMAARLLDEVQIKLRTVGGGIDAVPVAVDVARLTRESSEAVVVLPGFVGRDESLNRTVLGRGGADLTALFLAQQLKADCLLVKDVDGLYTSDPVCKPAHASRFAQVNYDTAIRLGGPVVQAKAIKFAAAHKLRFRITSIGAANETEVGPFADRLDVSAPYPEPLRVALLGCGTVGGGVFERLTALPELFKVIGVGTKTGVRARAAGVPEELMTSNLEDLIERPCDVVIELIGGTKRAASLIEHSLRLGRSVVTANKALLAQSHEYLSTLARETGTSLHYSAAVGGVLPALEAIQRIKVSGPIRSFSGVLNGTCNFILEQLALGSSFGESVREAQRLGYAEENPELDLEGIDAAQKLILLAHEAFDVSLSLDAITREGIQGLTPEILRQKEDQGGMIRLVVECSRQEDRFEASVLPVDLPPGHHLAQVSGAENRLIVQPEAGEPIIVSGAGAGRWPTTEAVMADLLSLRRRRATNELKELETLEACA